MAVLYDLLTGGPVGVQASQRRRWRDALAAGASGRGSRDPRRARPRPGRGIDAVLEVRIDGGAIAAGRASSVDANEHRVIDGARARAAPAFVDPHVHLRTPGREDEETIASGTAAAAAGGYCAILAMPNTDPVVDSAAVLGSLVEAARREAPVPVGFLAAITRGQQGEELTEMGELADAGAVALLRRRRARRLRRADAARAPVRVDHRPAARAPLRGADAFARRPRPRGRGRGRARLRRLPLGRRESVAVERDLSLAGVRGRPIHVLHLSARGVGRGAAPRAGGGNRRRAARRRRTTSSSPTTPSARSTRT